MKIFLGTFNIASVLSHLQKELLDMGIETFSVDNVDGLSPIVENNLDFRIQQQTPENLKQGNAPQISYRRTMHQSYLFSQAWKKAVEECDCFFFTWSSFLVNADDLRLLRQMGKKIGFWFASSEIRINSVHRQTLEFIGEDIPDYVIKDTSENPVDFLRKLHLLRMAEKYADFIVASPNLHGLVLRPMQRSVVPVICPTNLLKNCPQSRRRPVVLHAAGHNAAKGTPIWQKIFKRLQDEGLDFEPRVRISIPKEELYREMENADIFAYAIGRGGIADLEGLAAGCAVISSFCSRLDEESTKRQALLYAPSPGRDRFVADNLERARDCPAVCINENNVYEELKALILDHERRISLARQGRAWVEKWHGARTVAESLVRAFEGRDNDYVAWSNFYRDHYDPGSNPRRLALLNRYNRFVADCPWYKEHVAPGERAGLVF